MARARRTFSSTCSGSTSSKRSTRASSSDSPCRTPDRKVDSSVRSVNGAMMRGSVRRSGTLPIRSRDMVDGFSTRYDAEREKKRMPPTFRKKTPYFVRPPTAILTRGFDPRLSVGSARPAVFRSSTYVFSSPEAAERAFSIALGRSRPGPGESVDLIYSRLSHPNAEILEDQLVPLEKGAESAAVFNSGMAAISTLLLTLCPPGSSFVYTTPIYGGTQHLIHQLLEPFGMKGVPVTAGDTAGMRAAIANTPNLRIVLVETPANPTLLMTDIAAAADAAKARNDRPLVVVDNTFLGPSFQHPLSHRADLVVYSATKY